MKYKYIRYIENDALNGVFAYLNRYFPKLFVVEANSQVGLNVSPHEITRRDRDDSYSHWTSDSDAQLIISFTHPILLTSYTIEKYCRF